MADDTQQADVVRTERTVQYGNHEHESWWWERPNGQGDLGYDRPDVLLRCQRIWGGRVKVIRQESVTTTYDVTPTCPPAKRAPAD